MPLSRMRTPGYITPSKKGKQKRITIPQPEDRVLSLRKRDVVLWKEVNLEPWWFTLHRRGVRRPKIGEDPLEARAVSKDYVRGTLPERIVYLYLTDRLKMASGIDFTFQSSLQGGRLELGGIVADFVFPLLKMIIQVQGPTHDTFLRIRKDQEQVNTLTSMGFLVLELLDETIYNEYLFEEWMRRAFGLANGIGGSGGALGPHQADQDLWVMILAETQALANNVSQIVGAYGNAGRYL